MQKICSNCGESLPKTSYTPWMWKLGVVLHCLARRGAIIAGAAMVGLPAVCQRYRKLKAPARRHSLHGFSRLVKKKSEGRSYEICRRRERLKSQTHGWDLLDIIETIGCWLWPFSVAGVGFNVAGVVFYVAGVVLGGQQVGPGVLRGAGY